MDLDLCNLPADDSWHKGLLMVFLASGITSTLLHCLGSNVLHLFLKYGEQLSGRNTYHWGESCGNNNNNLS